MHERDLLVVLGKEAGQRVLEQPDNQLSTGNIGHRLCELPSGESGPPRLRQAGEYVESSYRAIA